ncbi:deoxyguanosinetriphosphate triphosphohydrolase [Reyranella sp. CPCC 100927]|uniref:deoxyguanosinetriphosphate triphosphohydrolase n=1 Tax=Reyranella sp. CPCC 100927 TaxID=2599616 RepID=UPI0011B7F147|nr:deoxyguanosinetriphosphate triphosphohydrolase [Reyranella sp. CPCC 100927]TWT06016.1 deoxyguanosinetriphosphate triphosphohydrolase [Reyranella sp. CPCC 100927]
MSEQDKAIGRDGRVLAPYASNPHASRGRLHAEAESATRSPYQRDRDRVIHSTAFRRLKHKTQVFVYHEGDHYRTRLTHTLEVAQIARSICRTLALDEDLAEALALAHDLGHTPFGHAGEDALDAAMKPFGGFDHNAQTLRILTKLEHRYAAFDGLNLTWEALEGAVKHNGPLLKPGVAPTDLPAAIVEFSGDWDLELDTWAGPEAQVAAISDDIAYNNHDIDDGLRAGLFHVDDLLPLPLVGDIIRAVRQRYPTLDQARLIHETVRRLINVMVEDVVAETTRRLQAAAPASVDDLRRLDRPVVAFSDALTRDNDVLKSFLFDRMYRHWRVNRMTSKARRVVADLFSLLFREPECLPDEWRSRAKPQDERGRARVVADYIAGMTDNFALEEHRRLYDLYA